ncbi:MAG: cytochrome c oxidase subunit 3 [Saprospiraceae bacterium]|nr:cytochrome c oxidase subunit 3 [Saprospiraceae bacterium]
MPIVQMFHKELPPDKIQAYKFALWIGMASIIMFFAAITSAYLVRKPVGNWYEFKLPVQFFYSTILIVLSSVFIENAYKSMKLGNENRYKLNIVFGTALGLAFIVMQIISWKVMVSTGLFIDLNVSVSFLYVISGFHALHVIGGLVVLLISLLNAFLIEFQPDPMRILKSNLVRQYWHFVGILWLYLLIFLILQ